MRLYVKLSLLALLACVTQAAITSDAAREAYFAAQCYVAHRSRDSELENRLVAEFQTQLEAEIQQPLALATARHDTPSF